MAAAALWTARDALYGLLDKDEQVQAALDEYLTPGDLRFALSLCANTTPAKALAARLVDAMLAATERAERPDLVAGLQQLRDWTTTGGGSEAGG